MKEALLNRTRKLIAGRIGLQVRDQDDVFLREVIAERARALNFSSSEQYCQYLESDADIRLEREVLAIPLTTGETYFFRDSGQHALLQNSVLPELLERRKMERALRIWCAACSSGEEAYSLAILLDELMADQSQWIIFIIGTDINRSAIEKARQGIYTEWSFRGISGERRQRYFRQHKNAWMLNDVIRRRVIFRTGDLIADEFPDYASDLYGMDLILCRNTFIYMTPDVVSRIADKFTETLADGGMLITGHGELYAHHLGKLRARVFPESIVYQKAAAPFFCPTPVFSPATATLAGTPRHAPEKPSAVSPSMQNTQPSHTPAAEPPAAGKDISNGAAIPEMQQAWLYANRGQRDLAEKSCSGIIEKNPLFAEPHYLLALLAQERGDFADAKDLLKKAIYLDPSFIAAYLDLGDLYARAGDGARADKMRVTARDLLRALPGGDRVKLYGDSSVNAVLQYVEHLLTAHY